MIINGRDIIRAGYASGKRVSDIASECGSTRASVRGIAHKMGLRHPYKVHLTIPAERMDDYRVLRSLGRFKAREAAAILGMQEAGL